jgi:acetylglutamate kinase
MTDSQTVLSALSFVKRLTGHPLLIKLGGAALQNLDGIESFCEDVSLLRAMAVPVVIVHGGGPMINAELTARGITWEFLDGQRVTTPEIMEVIETVLCGTVNRKIVRALNVAGVPAVGLSGIEAATLRCRQANPTLGKVGMIESVDPSLIEAIWKTPTRDGRGAIPVLAPIGVDDEGQTFNINADWAATRIAQSLGIRKIVFLTGENGVLDSAGSVIPELDGSELDELIMSGVVSGGMLTKARTMVEALRQGVDAIHVLNGGAPHVLVDELFTERGAGTVCRRRSRGANEGELR